MEKELEELFEEQCRRFLLCGFTTNDLDAVHEILSRADLSIVQIQAALTLELKRVLQLRYDTNMNTNRLDGYGWNSSKIREHMKKTLSQKLHDMARIFNTYSSSEMQVDS